MLYNTRMVESKKTPRYARKAEIARVVETVRQCGISIGSVSISPDGTISISQARLPPATPGKEFDRLEAAGLL